MLVFPIGKLVSLRAGNLAMGEGAAGPRGRGEGGPRVALARPGVAPGGVPSRARARLHGARGVCAQDLHGRPDVGCPYRVQQAQT